MKITDYGSIAPRYDKNPVRRQITRDDIIGDLLEEKVNPRVLDLACGTGNYLAAQCSYYEDAGITWYGHDLSEEMLEFARAKLSRVALSKGMAEDLPFTAGSFDYVSCNFAFHHFRDKHAVLDETARVTAPGGRLRVRNIDPYRMPGSWVYHYFPQTREIDMGRFWTAEQLFSEIERRGYRVEIRIETTVRRFTRDEMLAEARYRDMSQLNLVSDAELHEGVKRIENDTDYLGDFALISCIATKELS